MTGVLMLIEPDVQLQNGFGAMVHSKASCRYDLRGAQSARGDCQPPDENLKTGAWQSVSALNFSTNSRRCKRAFRNEATARAWTCCDCLH